MQKFPLNPDKSPACSAWQTFAGNVSGEGMFGVTPPSGFYVIDVDSYKEDGIKEKIEQVLGCSINWEESHIQTTLNGGTHHAFIIPDNVKLIQGSNMMGVQGFDTRASGRGYIASGEGYSVIDADDVCSRFDDFLPELPKEALAKLTVSLGKDMLSVDKTFRAAESVVTNSDGSPLTKSQMIATLENLPSEIGTDNDSWVDVCAGFKRQLLAMGVNEERVNAKDGWGFKVLTLWSKKRFSGTDAEFSKVNSSNYNRWKSFKLNDDGNAGKIITFKSVISLAKDNGGLPQSPEVVKATGEKLKAECSFINDYVMDAKTGGYIRRDNLVEYRKDAYNNEHLFETPLNSKGNPQKPSEISLGHTEVVSDVMYAPSFEQVFTLVDDGRKYLNSYIEPKHKSCGEIDSEEVKAALVLVTNHLEHLLDDKKERELILFYLAHNIQFPGKKLPWGIILQGAQGDGKSFFAEMMRMVMGKSNVRVMNADTLQSNFSGWAAGQCMVFIEELKLDNFKKYEIVNRIKPYISNPTIEWVRKYKEPLTCPNTSNYFCFTNYKDAIPLDDNDRRYAVFFSKWQGSSIAKWNEENPKYYPELYNKMRKSGEALYCAFANITIPDWFLQLNRAPKTIARQAMISLSRSPAVKDVQEAIDDLADKVLLDDGKTLNATLLGVQIKVERQVEDDDTLYANFPDPVKEAMKLIKVIESMGWVKSAKRQRVEGKLCTVYHKM